MQAATGGSGLGAGAGTGAAKAIQLKVLFLPSSFGKMCISGELAAHLLLGLGARARIGGATARVVSPLGKVWDVEVGRDDDDGDGRAFLGRGWPEFAAAHGLGVGWFVVLRHEGGGVLTVKVFDTTWCLREFGTPHAAAVLTNRSGRARDVSHKPQFLRVLLPGFMEKMRIPDKFVQHYIAEEHLNSNMAIILSPLGKLWRIELEKDQLGMFFKGGWSQFLSFHDISPNNVVLLKYEGNLVFKIKVFGHNGWQKNLEAKDIKIQQNTGNQPESSSFCRNCNNKNRKGSSMKRKTMGGEKERQQKSESIYVIGPPSWIKKEFNNFILERCLSLSGTFCKSIGLVEEGTITLRTSAAGDSSGSWEVLVHVHKKRNGCCYLLGASWKRFCRENGLKAGDFCTFNVVETTLWHVVIDRASSVADAC